MNKITLEKKKVEVSKEYLEYLEKGTSAAIKAGVYKVRLFDKDGKCYGMQG